jgi:hypothetical protein
MSSIGANIVCLSTDCWWGQYLTWLWKGTLLFWYNRARHLWAVLEYEHFCWIENQEAWAMAPISQTNSFLGFRRLREMRDTILIAFTAWMWGTSEHINLKYFIYQCKPTTYHSKWNITIKFCLMYKWNVKCPRNSNFVLSKDHQHFFSHLKWHTVSPPYPGRRSKFIAPVKLIIFLNCVCTEHVQPVSLYHYSLSNAA